MKRKFIKPEIKSVMILSENMILSSSSVDVKGKDYEEGSMTDLSRGNNNDEVREYLW